MIDLTKELSQARFDRRMNYVGKVRGWAQGPEYKDSGIFSLLIEIPDKDYKVILGFKDMKVLVDESYPDKIPSRQQALSLLAYAVDNLDLEVFCTCADFKYRFHYVVSVLDAIPKGLPTQDIKPKVTNPGENGFLCKHLSAVLSRPSSWTSKAVTHLRDAIMKDRGVRDE